MTRTAETAEIKALLQDRIADLCRTLAPDGRRSGAYWIARNPARDDHKPGSFWIKLSNTAGAWRDEATGDKGDVLQLVAYCQRLADFASTIAWAKDWLGLASVDPQTLARTRRRIEKKRAAAEAEAAERLARQRKAAKAQWLAAAPIAGTLAERYLLGRGIPLADLAQPPRALRCGTRTHKESGQELPAMLACVTGPDETFWALHATFLRPDGCGKAAVDPARKIWPSYRGGAIRLSKGETKLRPREAAAEGLLDTLALTEGIEDGLSVALACPELRVWAAGALGNLGAIRVPECSAEVVVCADNDWGKPGAERQLAAALEALARQGRPVKVARSPIGKDVNDALRGVAG